MSYETVFEQYRRGKAPKKDEWSLCDPVDGWTIAHTAAGEGRLPAAFGDWDLVDNVGVSVAHVYALDFVFPSVFTFWHLVDHNGDTVAHLAARHKTLPLGFENWGLLNREGKTVAHVAALYGSLPKDFRHWGLRDREGNSVAHIAASVKKLPNLWRVPDVLWMKNNEGVCVSDILNQHDQEAADETRARESGRIKEMLNTLKNAPRSPR